MPPLPHADVILILHSHKSVDAHMRLCLWPLTVQHISELLSKEHVHTSIYILTPLLECSNKHIVSILPSFLDKNVILVKESHINYWNTNLQIWIYTAVYILQTSWRMVWFDYTYNLLMYETKLRQTELLTVFGMNFCSPGLLEVCMMTHRVPLNPPSTTQEIWPLTSHMWVWDSIAIATSISARSLY